MRTGLHCNTTRNSAKLYDYYRRSGAKVVKVMQFEPDVLNTLKAMGVTIIGRVYEDNQSISGTKAGDFINRVVAHARDYPQVDYWEGYNEAFSDGPDMSRFADIEIARMAALESIGRKAIICNFSTGTPTEEDWPRFRPALEYAYAHGHALGLHEYSGPFMQWLAGENQWDHKAGVPKRVDDPCLDPNVEGWLTLRYRKAYRLFRQWGIGTLPLFITEGGIDDVQPRPGPQGKGYKDWDGTEWANLIHGNYAQQRGWYMWQVSHDSYVKGVVDFGWDTADPQWRSFDLSTDDDMVNRIIKIERDLPAGSGGQPMTLNEYLYQEGTKQQAVHVNPDNVFQKKMMAHGLFPTNDEHEVSFGGEAYVVQLAGKLGSPAVARVYWAKKGDWGNVKWIDRLKVR